MTFSQPRWRTTLALVLLGACVLAGEGDAATSSTTVGATVPSATSLDVSGCAANTPGITDFGSVVAGSSQVTTADCTVGFGSSNDTAGLRMVQPDATGIAMWRPPAGSLDTSFAGDGVSERDGPASGVDSGRTILPRPDGSVVVVGYCTVAGTFDACLTRLLPNGTPDPSFGTGGVVTAPGGTGNDSMFDGAFLADGSIVTVGTCDNGSFGADLCALHFSASGVRDMAFNSTGVSIQPVGAGALSDALRSVVVQPDGKILAGGACAMGAGTGTDFCLVRYLPSGALDLSFAAPNGYRAVAIGAGAANDTMMSLELLPDGRILAIGYCDTAATGIDVCMARFQPDGTNDTTFNGTGKRITAVGPTTSNDYATSSVLRADGRIDVFGSCGTVAAGNDLCAMRFAANGGLDTTFNTTGFATVSGGPGAAFDYGIGALESRDGSLVAAGYCTMPATGRDLCFARWSSSGARDLAVGAGSGVAIVPTAPGAGHDQASDVAELADGRLVTTGACTLPASNDDICTAAFANGGTFAQYGAGTWSAPGSGLFGACLSSVASGAVATWTLAAGCPAVDGVSWNAVPTAASTIATTSAAQPGNAVVGLRFGLRVAPSQAPGQYVAPIDFEVVAPAS